jgi:hypothetical protein
LFNNKHKIYKIIVESMENSFNNFLFFEFVKGLALVSAGAYRNIIINDIKNSIETNILFNFRKRLKYVFPKNIIKFMILHFIVVSICIPEAKPLRIAKVTNAIII